MRFFGLANFRVIPISGLSLKIKQITLNDMEKLARKVLIVEDDALLAEMVKKVLQEIGFLVETASSSAIARKKVDTFDPDLVLLDLALGDGPSGIHLAHSLSDSRPDIAILVLTKYSDAKSISSQALELPDSVGFLRKQLVAKPSQLVEAIEQVLADKSHEVRQDKQSDLPFASLPKKGQDVLRLLAESYTNQEIANRLSMSVKSVEGYVALIYQELGIATDGPINPRVAAATKYLRETGAAD